MTRQNHTALLETLQRRFERHPQRHPGISWADVHTKLVKHPKALQALGQMEETGGEPDVVVLDGSTRQLTFCDCSPESPTGRRSLCYDRAALDARKEHKPTGNALEMASAMGITLLTEVEYRALQHLGAFDTKTSSWVATPTDIRSRGGALFCDRRYDTVFLYHNGAESYYAARGFRGKLEV